MSLEWRLQAEISDRTVETLKHFPSPHKMSVAKKEKRKYIHLLLGYFIKRMLLDSKRKQKPQFEYRTQRKQRAFCFEDEAKRNFRLIFQSKHVRTDPDASAFLLHLCRTLAFSPRKEIK